MKNLILAAIISLSISAFAQPGQEKMTFEQKVELATKKMKLDLDLNDKQTLEIKKIVSEQIKKRENNKAQFEKMKAEGKKPSPTEIFEMKNKMLDEQITMKASLKKILSSEQYEKWDEIHQDRMEKLQMRRHHMREKGKRE